MNKLNKTLLFTDLCLFAFSIALFSVCSIWKDLFPLTVSPVNIGISAVCSLAVVLIMLFQYRRKQSIGVVNIVIPLVLTIALYGIYHLPVFDFVGVKGLHNGFCGLFVFTLFSRFALNLSLYLKSNYGYTVTSSNLRANVQGRGSIAGAYVIAKILKIYAVFMLVGGIAIAMFNAFMPVIDMSTPYQMFFLHKTMAEIMSH